MYSRVSCLVAGLVSCASSVCYVVLGSHTRYTCNLKVPRTLSFMIVSHIQVLVMQLKLGLTPHTYNRSKRLQCRTSLAVSLCFLSMDFLLTLTDLHEPKTPIQRRESPSIGSTAQYGNG